jgi:signal peptidase I
MRRGASLVSGPEYMSDVPTVAVAPAAPRVDVPTTDDAPAPPDRDDGSGQRTRKVVVEWVLLIGGALLIAFLIKTFLFQAFYIPSESMTPTLQVGDRVLVNKLSYRLHDVNRGDIVVFEAPDDPNTGGVKDLVKRVVGLPGETVELRDGQVFIDGNLLEEPYLADGDAGSTRPTQDFAGKCEPPVRDSTCTVPAGSYLVLGDNRDQSKDGRVFGPISESDIVGRVFVRIWPLDDLGFL